MHLSFLFDLDEVSSDGRLREFCAKDDDETAVLVVEVMPIHT
jgi:hypothetical protein